MEPIKIFYCYVPQDRNLRDRLEKHLMSLKRLGKITLRLNREIHAGTNWSHVEDRRFQAADLILLLISPDFIASDYYYGIEMRHILEKHEAGNVSVIPIILRPIAFWEKTPLGKLQVLPKGGKAITECRNRDAVLVTITKEISEVVAILLAQKQELALARNAGEGIFPNITQVIGPLCATCGARNPFGITTCENCGDLLFENTELPIFYPQEKADQSEEQFCKNCGAANSPTARFCQYCTTALPFKHTTRSLPKQTRLSGRYQLESCIGQGGMGAVYKASDTRFNNRPIAIKEMSRAGLSPANIQEAEAAFEREARILADLLHPNLPRIYDYFTEGERSCLVMDFIEGQTLKDFLDKANGSPLPLGQVLKWWKQLCEVLDYLHTRQPSVIFRDLKPSNVMICDSGHIFLIDFGIARIFKPGRSHDTVAMGSPGFAAPEQYGKAQSSPRSDIYNLGALLHNLLTGIDPSEQPFFFCPASQLNPAVSLELEQLLQQMLEMQAEKRPASVQEVLKVLRQVELQHVNNTYSQPLPTVSVSRSGLGTTSGAGIQTTSGRNTTGTADTTRTSSSDSLLQDASRFCAQNRWEDALKLYDHILQTESNNPLAWQGRGLVQAQRGQHHEALSSFEQALNLDPNLVVSLNGKGTALDTLHRNQEALEAFDRAILLEKENVVAWNGKGAALSALDLPEQAVTAFDVALHYDPLMAQAWNNKGLVLRHLRRYPEALHAFEEALLLDSHSAAYWNGKGQVLSEMGRFPEAKRAYQEALQLDSKYAPAYCGLGEILYGQNQMKEALEHFEHALSYDSHLGRAWEKRGAMLVDIGRFNKALESYDEALRLDPHNIAAWNGKASTLCGLQRYQEALDAYNRALLINANAAQAWNGKGNALYHLGNYELALDSYERALRLNPRMASAQHNKSLVLKHLERYDEALNAAEHAIRLAPKDPDNWQRKAEALKKLRRKREARAAEAEVARLREGPEHQTWLNTTLRSKQRFSDGENTSWNE